VANFICTAWPIDDDAARQFAERFYRGILGFLSADGSGESLHEAMRAARCAIAKIVPGGMQTWGAYQHYGDPNLRLISDASRTIAPGSPKMPNRNKPARTPSGRGKRRN
jgi:hypothetical protein